MLSGPHAGLLQRGRTVLPPRRIHCFGVIPKGVNTGKWYLITDLSFPPDASVNDGINPALCSLSSTLVELVAGVAAGLGRVALLAKTDIEFAYRIIPVHPQDRPQQAVGWDGKVYMLPFGLRSAPKIFMAVADALEWHVRQNGVSYIYHHLDDFVVVGVPGSEQCTVALDILRQECASLGVAVAE